MTTRDYFSVLGGQEMKLSKSQRQNIRRRWGCEPDEYVKALERQGGVCAICKERGKFQLRADTFRTDGKTALVCYDCFHMLKIIASRLDDLMEYIESRGKVGGG